MEDFTYFCTHEGEDPSRYLGAVTTPIFQNSLFTACEGNAQGEYAYTRVSNPTTEVAEKKIAAMEGAEAAKCFSSGMGAISAAIMHGLKKDSHVVAVASIYGPARRFLEDYMKRFGVQVDFVNGTDVEEIRAKMRKETDLIYLESPSTYLFLLQDLQEVSGIARQYGALTVVDNTYSTPIFQNPLKFGIDLVVHSASKYLGGHSDIIGGVVAGSQERIAQIALEERELFGAVMSPFDSWLLIRGLRTLPIRLEQHQKNAMAVLKALEGHRAVKEIIYPFHPSHPQYDLARKQMRGASGLCSVVFDLDGSRIKEMCRKLKLFYTGPSWGGYESLISPVGADLPADNAQMKRGLVRLHIGLETPQLLIDDLMSALEDVM